MMCGFKSDLEILKSLIGSVLNQSIGIYDYNTKEDRAELHEIEYRQKNGDFSILGNLEVWSDAVVGIAHSIVKKKINQHPRKEKLTLLEENNIFQFPEFNKWFFAADKRYTGIRLYVELIDYLRRLCIEYLNRLGK